MYLKSIQIQVDHFCFKNGTKFEDLDKDIVLLVGDQGTGKSTLINIIAANKIKMSVEMTIPGKTDTYKFDFEKDNPRMKGDLSGIRDSNTYKYTIATHFHSHGEVLKEFSLKSYHKMNNSIILLDEPETALSIRNQYKMIKELEKGVKENKNQFIIATHCLPLIQSQKQVFSMEHGFKWMDSEQFIEEQKK